ncbi:MAG TPA: sodium-translocating pyrophosphatase [Longimicrobium sp.]|nr:sodium-translocating pyrophosphatase [Longimicrobium sp.]
MSLTDFTAWTAWPLGVVGLLLAFGALVYVRKQPRGNEAMRDWAGQIQRGANAFLRRQTIALAVFVVVGACLLAPVASIPTAGAFALGAATALAAGWVAVFAATRANVRVAEAARVAGEIPALRVALGGAAAAGFTIASLGLVGIGALYFGLIYIPGAYVPEQFARFGEILAGFALGASSIALFARVGAGIFTKAAEAGADLVGRADLPRDDPRNPATVADNVGDCVGDTAGMGVDLLESFVGAVVATIALGAYSSAYANNRPEAVALPILVAGAGLLATFVGIAAIRAVKSARPTMVLRAATLGAGVLFLILAFLAVAALGLDLEDPVAGTSYHRYGPFWAILAGALSALAISVVTEYYTGARPTRRIMRAASGGPADTVIMGLAVGMESTAIPLVLIAASTWVAHYAAGLYGIGIAAVGMLATVGVTITVNAFAAIADTAGGIARMSHLPGDARRITRALKAAGSSAAAGGKGIAIGSAGLTALALFSAYASAVRLESIDLIHPFVLLGLLLGGGVPFLAAALVMGGVGRTAALVAREVERQFTEIPGLMDGSAQPDSARCVDIATRSALRETALPFVLALVVPVAVGAALGTEALGGVLVGATVSGILLALFMTNAGAAWSQARARMDAEPGSELHAAVALGDAVGNPMKDAAGPALNILVKLMAVIALVLAPWFLSLRGQEVTPLTQPDDETMIVREVAPMRG